MESILVIGNYVEMLAQASGRVLMLSYRYGGCYCTCHFGPLDCKVPMAFPTVCSPITLLDGVIQRVGQNLARRAEALGIRVCSVSVGPLIRSNIDDHDAKRCVIQARCC